jgi:hypothetical protein
VELTLRKRDIPVDALPYFRPTYTLKPKNEALIPHRVAMALQADGWIVRMDICWAKPNPMPESVTDRPTKSHEYLFLLAKRERYFWDAEAVKEEAEYGRRSNFRGGGGYLSQDVHHGNGQKNAASSTTHGSDPSAGRNMRSVLTIPTEAYPGAHFATFPRKLVEPCVRAGTSERGCCPTCGAGWVRMVERGPMVIARSSRGEMLGKFGKTAASGTMVSPATAKTLGWQPACTCPEHEPVPCIVLDPFVGAGTTLVVANALGRDAIGLDLSREYLGLADRRNARPHARPERVQREEHRPLFAGIES